jgi:CubicO group peptidase (beta-lactamase class C family)
MNMKHLLLLSVFAFLTAGISGQIKESGAIDSIFAEWDRPGVPGCALGIIKDGELIYARGYGMANLEYDIPNEKQSVFRIASTSKQFTAACIMILVQQGRLELDNTLDQFFPDFPEYAGKITVRHLLNHTSGIRDYLVLASLKGLSDNDYYTDKDVMEWLTSQDSLNFMPGEEHLYSNSGYWLLGQIVGRVAGENMAEFARKNLFEPLGMSQTHFHNDHTRIVKNRASGYVPDSAGGFRISMTTLDMIGDGGIFTSVEDIKKWDDAYYDSGLLDEAFWRMMTQRGILNSGDTIDYAAGLSIANYKGLKTVSHGGAFVGFRSNLIRFPEQRFSIVLFANRADANLNMAYQVADIFLHDQFSTGTGAGDAGDREPATASEAQEFELAQMTGRYEVEPGIILEIGIENDSLHVVQAWNNSSYNVARTSGNTFQVPGVAEISFIFSELQDGFTGLLTVDFSGDKTKCKRKKEIDISGMNLEEYCGNYFSTELDVTYSLFVENGMLKVRIKNNDPFELTIEGTDQFASMSRLYRFVRENGEISGFKLDAGRVKNISFMKR